MARPFLLVQLSDPHIGADWFDDQSVPRLAAAVESVRAVRPKPDAVLMTGDIADHATDEEYGQVLELIAPLRAPLYVVPGNHDDRRALHRNFGVPGGNGEPVCYSVDLGPMRLVLLDTTRPGKDSGSLDGGRLDWLDAELAAAPDQLTLLAMHHPPILTGMRVWDDVSLAASDRRTLGGVIDRHRQVRRLACGHFHRAINGELAGCGVLVAPSTYVQMRPWFRSRKVKLVAEPAGFVLHTVVDGELTSQVHPVH
jgi:3',5'-cyclic AMP phosphodiesterase CpdA